MSKKLIVDTRMSEKCKNTLRKMGFELIEMPKVLCLQEPVAAHPDMSLFKLCDVWYCARDVHNLFTFKNIEIIDREDGFGKTLEYPKDVTFNCAVVGKYIICNSKYVSKKIIDDASSLGYGVINVKQGYAKCSISVVSDNGIITEDDGIAKECQKYGFDVLKIKKGHVLLDGYDYGFIGGASGLIDDGVLAFNGNVYSHPDANEIVKFCEKHNVSIINLSDEPLYDVGSIYRV